METAIQPGIYDSQVADGLLFIRTEEAYHMAKKLAELEGLFVGFSAAAAVLSALRVASELQSGLVVTIMPDSGHKYLSDRFWRG
jgi:cysteine synthase B